MNTNLRLAALAAAGLAPALGLAEPSADELAKQLANPVAALISVPFQLNYDNGAGATGTGDRYTLNVQPVIPISLNSDWNVISRTIVPIIGQHDVLAQDSSEAGLGDIVQSAFLSPKAPTAGGWVWGVGPVLLIPTGRDGFTANRWAGGPTAVALRQVGPWSYGALVNQLWSFTSDSYGHSVNAMFLQPFVSRGLGKGVTAGANFESTYDWNSGHWTVPMNLTLTKVTKIGSQLVSVGGGVRYYFSGPNGTPDWGLRASFTLLFPR